MLVCDKTSRRRSLGLCCEWVGNQMRGRGSTRNSLWPTYRRRRMLVQLSLFLCHGLTHSFPLPLQWLHSCRLLSPGEPIKNYKHNESRINEPSFYWRPNGFKFSCNPALKNSLWTEFVAYKHQFELIRLAPKVCWIFIIYLKVFQENKRRW